MKNVNVFRKIDRSGKYQRLDNKENILLEIKNLKTYFPVSGGVFRKTVGWVKAVDDVSFSIKKGEIFGLVGESGCGKSTIARSIVRLYKPGYGEINYYKKELTGDNREIYLKVDLCTLNRFELKKYRSDIQMIFQDPYSSLNPRLTVQDIVSEPIYVHGFKNRGEIQNRVVSLLEKVGLNKDHIYRYPHEFSGGQRQRIGIARALSTNPNLIIADEPVSALDVSIQAQVINLMQELQEELGLSYIFIAHDISVVKHISHKIGVMYLGNLVELSTSDEIYFNPIHPYTKVLISAVPKPIPGKKTNRKILKGEVPSPMNKPGGCPFNTRCSIVKDICKIETPEMREITKGHFAACHFC